MISAKFLHNRGVDAAYTDEGAGLTVILLHGFPFDRSMWRDQIEALADNGFRAIAPDLRGLGETVAQTSVGESSRASHRLKSVPRVTMEEMARDVGALMDRLELDRAVLCGLSMGCYVAFEFIRLFPERVKGLVLAGGRAEGPDAAEKKSREEQARRVLEEGMGGAVDSILKSLLASHTLATRLDLVLRVGEMVKPTNPRGAAAAQRGMAARRDYSDELAKIGAPALIVAGREDSVRKPADAEFIHRAIKNSTLKVIDEAGHLMNMEQPEVFNEALLGFIKSIH